MALLQLILVLGTIVGVTDGDTIRVKNDVGQTAIVKLACIKTPPVAQRSDNLAATQRLKELLPPGIPVVVKAIEKDQSDRTVGEVFLDNRSINLRLVEEGKAVVDQDSLYNCDENKTQFLIAEANAKNKRLGLWQRFNAKLHKDLSN
ncbi:thermonuclease family protein [Calothrix sp. PCC 7507]|uniref:thermonuclease family protein n=1 Tax=Calothrix sp. PCC 7507 TaxID=99598 RepID=UPI00029F1D15|nr:thermonuclease family protein [Calothrix sp. PCC 7507]AFY31480.1 nuclease (SNase domain-containing protein) [Calothrix sp. PCC 7507]